MSSTGASTSSSGASSKSNLDVYPSQVANVAFKGTLEDLYDKAPLTVVTFLYTNELESEQLRNKTKSMMLSFDLVKNVQFVEVPVDVRENLRIGHNVNWSDVPTVIIFSKVREITRLRRPSLDLYHSSVNYHFRRLFEFKAALSKPFQLGPSWRMKSTAKALVRTSNVVLLINGNVYNTWCQSSRSAINILYLNNIKYDAHNVQLDEAMWHALRDIAKFKVPFPHVYLNGKMMGGLDYLLELMMNGIVKSALNPNPIKIPKVLKSMR